MACQSERMSHGQEELEMPKLDQFTLRFPDLTEKILGQLDNENLEKFKTAGRSLKMTVENQRIYWIRKIQKYAQNNNLFEKEWKEAVKKTPVEILKTIATEIWTNLDVRRLVMLNQGMSPLGIASASGNLDLFTYLMEEKTEDLNLKDQIGGTIFHFAAVGGHHDICQVLIGKLEGIPRDDRGATPLHWAAQEGHLNVCDLIMNWKELVDKNPVNNRGITPLHDAAFKGHLNVCDLIMKELVDKNPVNNVGSTPLHAAAQEGHLNVCDLIMKEVVDKNPAGNSGITPLHVSAREGHLNVCDAIMKELVEKNPAANNGSTPLHKAAERGHFDICQLICKNVQNKNPEDINGVTPLDLAGQYNHWKLVDFLVGLLPS